MSSEAAGASGGGELGQPEGEGASLTFAFKSGSEGGHHVAGGSTALDNPEKVAEEVKQTEEMEGLDKPRSATPTVNPTLEAVVKEGGNGSGSSSHGDVEWNILLKMEAARREEAFERRLVRRALWVRETRKVIEERKQFQQSGAATRFPELVWKQILVNVEDPKVKAMMSNMSLLWKELLKRERTKFLFDAVFPLLNENGMLTSSDVLACRGVCREWKASMETWLQNFEDYFHPPTMWEMFGIEEIRTPAHSLVDLMPLKFRNGNLQLARFSGWSRLTYQPTENPFPSRRLSLGDRPHVNERGSNLFWTEAERLLAVWGGEVWTVEIALHFPSTPDVVYDRVCNILKLMPNLRTLFINVRMGWAAFRKPLQDTPFLKTRLFENPLPELPHLMVMSASFLPPLMLKAMLNKFGPTLTMTIVDGTDANRANTYGEAKLPSLKQLSLSLGHLFEADSPFTVDWPALDQVHLTYNYEHVEEIQKLFQGLNNLGGQLRKLSIILQKKTERPIKLDIPTIKMLSLELPNLEHFSLAMARSNLKTIDFILPMVSLKSLTVSYARTVIYATSDFERATSADEGPGHEGHIKFWSCINRLYDSNIWSLFPELHKVTVSIVGCLSEGLEVSDTARYRMRCCEFAADDNECLHGLIYTRQGYEQHRSGQRVFRFASRERQDAWARANSRWNQEVDDQQ